MTRGEDSATQFKADVRNGESLAFELAAFDTCEGGVPFIGVADNSNGRENAKRTRNTFELTSWADSSHA